MAGLPPPAGFVAAAPTPTFSNSVFNDPAKDPDVGNYAALLAPFLYDIHNNVANRAVADIRDLVNGRSSNMDPLAMIVLVDGSAKVYLCPKRLDQPLGSAAHPRWNQVYAFDGDLLGGTAYNAQVDNATYELIQNSIHVPTLVTILAAVGGDPTLVSMGPYANGDAGTEVVRVRKTIPVPFAYVNIFLANVVTPKFYFESIYPQIVNDGREAECLALHRFFQVGITIPVANGASVLNSAALPTVPRDPIIHQSRTRLLHYHLPGLSHQAQQQQHNAIANQIASVVTQQQNFRLQDEQAKRIASAKTVEMWIGAQQLQKLLRYCHVQAESNLAPIWLQLASAKKSERLSIVQGMYDFYREQLGESHLTMVADLSVLTHTTSVCWDMVTRDSIKTGIQPFRFPETDLEAYQRRNAEIELMLSGQANPSFADARAISEAKVILPSSESSNRHMRRMQIWALTWLPQNHPMTLYLKAHYEDMQSFKLVWDTWVPALRPSLARAKGVYHCKYIANVMSDYWRRQGMQPTPLALESPLAISSAVNSGRAWEPIMDHSFLTIYKVFEYCGAASQQPVPSFVPSGDPTLPPTQPPAASPQPTTNGRLNNSSFNTQLFQQYRTSAVRCADLRRKVAEGALPALPNSKVNNQVQLCLAWHTKGQCNTNCPRVSDHVAYTAQEYQGLVTWCTSHYLSS
jgi:hypothetical protein